MYEILFHMSYIININSSILFTNSKLPKVSKRMLCYFAIHAL